MARILLVDNEAGDRRAAARALGIREQELESGGIDRGGAGARRRGRAPVRARVARDARGVARRRVRPRAATCCARRSTCSRTASACWHGTARSRSPTRSASACSAARCRPSCRASPARRARRSATADRSLSLDGRAFAARAYPLSERGVVLYIRDATDEREREIGRLQSEKLASIGMLAAGVAHEINNPAAFVLANIEALTGHMRLIEDKLRELPDADAGARRRCRTCCSRPAPSCRSRRRGWRAFSASCATWDRSRTPTRTSTFRSASTPRSNRR